MGANIMNRYMILMLLTFATIISNAQIEILDDPKKEETLAPPIAQYDSLMNFDANLDERTYIGQKVYCVKYYETPLANDNSKNPGEYNLEGKYLTIVENSNQFSYHKILLQDEEGKLYVFGGCGRYCAYEGRNAYFVLVGYYEKIKELYVGKDFIYVNEEEANWYNNYPFNGLFKKETHERNEGIKKGTKWHCEGVGISMDDIFSVANTDTYCNRVVLYLTNEKYGNYYCYTVSSDIDNSIKYGNKKNKYILNKFMTPQAYTKQQNANMEAAKAKKEAETQAAAERQQRLISLYGERKAHLILQGKVEIGFTKKMCREAWGEPKSTNTTTTAGNVHEQWVYSASRYLYFDNGVLTAIQE